MVSLYLSFSLLQTGLSKHATFSDFSPNLFIKCCWNCAWCQAFNNEKNWPFSIFKENIYYVQNGRSKAILGLKSEIFRLNNYVFLFFCHEVRVSSIHKRKGAHILRKILIVPKMGQMSYLGPKINFSLNL